MSLPPVFQAAYKPFAHSLTASANTEGYRPTAKDLRGLYRHRFDTAGGLVMDCYLDYSPEERATYDEPGSAAQIELVWALVGGIDINEVIGDLALTIEEKAMECMATVAEDSKADAAADRWEDARCEA